MLHRPRLVDGDRAPCTADHQAERVSRRLPHDDDVDRAPCTTRPREEPEPRLELQDEARAASGRRTSFKTFSGPSRSPVRAPPSKPPGSAESVAPVASALDRSASDKLGRSTFHATQLRSSSSDLPASGPDERVIEIVYPPLIPLLPDLARTRRIAASDAGSRVFFPATRAHGAIVSVPGSHDDTLDFGIEPASLAAFAANEDYVSGNSVLLCI